MIAPDRSPRQLDRFLISVTGHLENSDDLPKERSVGRAPQLIFIEERTNVSDMH